MNHDRFCTSVHQFVQCVMYSQCLIANSCSLQLLPLLMVTNHEHGGYNMDDNEIGVVLMVVAVSQLVWQVNAHTHTQLQFYL